MVDVAISNEMESQKIAKLLNERIPIDKPTILQCYWLNFKISYSIFDELFSNTQRDFSIPDFQCSNCNKWFHKHCIGFTIGYIS